jgi:hypothetical protein
MPLWVSTTGESEGEVLTYLLRDEFTTADAAPITSPRTCEPGPGLFDVADATNKFSISGGDLVCSGGQSAWGGDPSYGMGTDNAGTPAKVSLDSGYAAFWDFTPGTLGYARVGFATTVNPITMNSTYWYCHANGNIYLNGTTIVGSRANGTRTKVLLHNRTGTAGRHLIQDGTLLWTSTASHTTLAFPALSNYSDAFSLHDFALLDLPANGYSEWDADFSTVTDSESAPANSTYFDHVADCHITSTFTFEAGKYYYIYFRGVTGLASWNRLRCLTGGGADLASHSGGTYWSSGGVFSDGVEYKIDIVCEGSTVKVYVDNVLKTTQTITENATNLRGRINYTLATNDIVLSTHPYPSLGIATDRVIAPQNAETRELHTRRRNQFSQFQIYD